MTLKSLPDGRIAFNLGCSARIADGWNNIDFSWLVRLSSWPKTCTWLHRFGLLDNLRYERIQKISKKVVLWNLAKGIPCPNKSVDVIYHSHLLEHLDRDDAAHFIGECRKKLKPGGIIRIVVPDMEQLCVRYIDLLKEFNSGKPFTSTTHQSVLGEIIDQMVPKHPRERLSRPFLVRLAEHFLIGNSEKSGTLHRWMYDAHSLLQLLTDQGFVSASRFTHNTSNISDWNSFQLDLNIDGSPYKPFSLYIEAAVPCY